MSAYRRVGVPANVCFAGPYLIVEQNATTPLSEHADPPTRRYADTCFLPCPVMNADGSVNVIVALG